MAVLIYLNQFGCCILHLLRYAVQPADIDPSPCPHCGGELEFKASVSPFRKGSEIHFFQCKAAATFIRLN